MPMSFCHGDSLIHKRFNYSVKHLEIQVRAHNIEPIGEFAQSFGFDVLIYSKWRCARREICCAMYLSAILVPDLTETLFTVQIVSANIVN